MFLSLGIFKLQAPAVEGKKIFLSYISKNTSKQLFIVAFFENALSNQEFIKVLIVNYTVAIYYRMERQVKYEHCCCEY